MQDHAIAACNDDSDDPAVIKSLTPKQATRRGWSFLAAGALLLATLFTCQGCIPLMVGGYIGYQMAQSDAHSQWCGQHIGDPSCHP
jgi:hypothetical protein